MVKLRKPVLVLHRVDADVAVSTYCLCPQDAPIDECVLASMRWGLVPAWFKEDDPSKMHYSTSNCRSENILEKKSYKVTR